MSALKFLAAAALMTVVASPAFAMETMMMKKGETAMVMPNGEMATMPMMDPKMAKMMMKGAKPMKHGMIMMMGEDGKMYMMEDMKMPDGMMASEAMMKK